MTDTLRAECSALLDTLELTYRYCGCPDCKTKDADLVKLLAFARAQQAKGLREAAEHAEGWIEGKLIASDIRMTATAREQA